MGAILTSRDFVYWLQGYFELSEVPGNSTNISMTQVATIRKHLAMVFHHEIDPSFGKDKPALDKIHGPSKPDIKAENKPRTTPFFDSGLIINC